MGNDTDYTERAYTTSEVASMVDIAVPTVRKYCQHLEDKGYTYLKGKGTGQHQARLFLEKDVSALRYLKDIRKKGNMTVEQAASVVAERFSDKAIQSVRSSDIQYNEEADKRYNELKEMIQSQTEMIEKQNNLIEQLTNRLDQQQEYINERLNARDRLLMNQIDERMEEQKQLAAAAEEEKEEEKKGFFSRLFGR